MLYDYDLPQAIQQDHPKRRYRALRGVGLRRYLVDRYAATHDQGAESGREFHGDQPPDQAAGRRDRIDLEIFRNRECDHFERQLFRADGREFRHRTRVVHHSNEGVLVSVRQAESRTFQETEKRLQINYRNYPTGYHIFITLLEVRIDYDADMVELIARQVSSLSRNINGEDSIDKEVLRRINTLQESTMLLRENIFDRQRVLSGILRSERFPNDIYPRLQLMIKDVNSLINHADFSFQRLDYIQDAALGLINIEQNEIVKIFSVAAVVFMPATLIASIYGMNFSIMPELHWKYGYLFAIGLMLLCSGLTIWFFRFKKWL